MEVGDGEPPKAEFTITGDYDVFARISRAEMSSQRALMTGKLKVRGNMAKALKLAAVADRLNKVPVPDPGRILKGGLICHASSIPRTRITSTTPAG